MQAFTAKYVSDLIFCLSRASSKVRLIIYCFLVWFDLFIISGVIISDVYFHDLRAAMNGLLLSCYQVKNAHDPALYM